MGTIDDFDSTVTLSLDTGDCECGIITDFIYEGQSYIAVTPLDDQCVDSTQIFLYEFFTNGDDDFGIDNIAEEKYKEVADEFNRIMEEESEDEVILGD